MKKIVLIPDSFKGTMTSKRVCEIMKKTIEKEIDAQVITLPVADGGEGSVDAFLSALGGEKITCYVAGPYFEEIESFYGVLPDGTAIIEMAACAGLPLVEGRENPMVTTTLGVGQLIHHAIKKGCKKIILGLGGSCTNDGGVGAAVALGTQFYDKEGKAFLPVGGTLNQIDTIDTSYTQQILQHVELITMCDIDNPLYGENGAAYIFAPQKGATPEMVKTLDEGLKKLSEKIKTYCGIDVATLPGAGAAGGMGAGMVAFMKSKLEMGIEVVLDQIQFEKAIQDAALVFTGEGKIDSQSIRGKVIAGVAKRTKKAKIPLVAVVGSVGEGVEEMYTLGVNSIFSINKAPLAFEEARHFSEENLAFTMKNILKLMSLNGLRQD